MEFKVSISYEIDGLGTSERTKIYGLKQGDSFILGNPKGQIVILKFVYSDRVVLDFKKHSSALVLPNNEKEIEIKKGEEIRPYYPIDPSPSYKIKIEDITEEPIRYYE